MSKIKISTEGLVGFEAELFFTYLQHKITATHTSYYMDPDGSYNFRLLTPQGPHEYFWEPSHVMLCRPAPESTSFPSLRFIVNYIETDTKKIVGTGNFGKVFSIHSTYQCDKDSLTLMTTSTPLVVKMQHHCECGINETSDCRKHNPKVLGQKESRIGITIPHLGMQQIVFPFPRISFIVMRHIPGRPLNKILFDDLRGRSILSFRQRMDMTDELLYALWSQTNTLIHSDVKPENIIFCMESQKAWLIDYQNAKIIDPEKNSVTQKGLDGTPYYTAPEVTRRRLPQESNRLLTKKIDVFAMGRVLMQIWSHSRLGFKFQKKEELQRYFTNDLLLLTDLFEGLTHVELNDALKIRIKSFIQSMLQPDPQCRSSIDDALYDFMFIYQYAFAPAAAESYTLLASDEAQSELETQKHSDSLPKEHDSLAQTADANRQQPRASSPLQRFGIFNVESTHEAPGTSSTLNLRVAQP